MLFGDRKLSACSYNITKMMTNQSIAETKNIQEDHFNNFAPLYFSGFSSICFFAKYSNRMLREKQINQPQ